MIVLISVLIISFLIGSIPGAYIMGKVLQGTDIRTLGSGNAGATNAYRVLGLKGAIPALLIDFFKGFIPVFLISNSGYEFMLPTMVVALTGGALAFIGHLFPIYIGFKGGKGVATGAGIMTALQPLLFPTCLGVFLPVFLVTRKMSLASLCTAVSLPFWYVGVSFFLKEKIDIFLLSFTILISLIVFLRHRKNIKNLASGNEQPLY